MPFVLDSSVTLAWLLPDEGSAAVEQLADRLEQDSARVPSIWALEVGNALLVAQRRGRIKDDELARMIAALDGLPIEVDQEAARPALLTIVAVAKKLGLTTYDAAYVELAHRQGVSLATLDERLRAACTTMQVPVLP
jgi:predicted nucleic acid-binding protein